MSNEHFNAVRGVQLPPSTRFVLYMLADHACEFCGVTWVGIPSLEDETGLTRRTLQRALGELVQSGWIKIHAYSTGGRGKSTEYLIAPGVAKINHAECSKCRVNRKRRRGGAVSGTNRVMVTPLGGVGGVETASPVHENRVTMTPKPSIESNHHAKDFASGSDPATPERLEPLNTLDPRLRLFPDRPYSPTPPNNATAQEADHDRDE